MVVDNKHPARAYRKSYDLKTRRRAFSAWPFFVVLLVLSLLAAIVAQHATSAHLPHNAVPAASAPANKPAHVAAVKTPARPDPSQKLQNLLNSWQAAHPGEKWGVVVQGTGQQNNWRAAINSDEVFDADSLYKLFVVYYAYQQVDNGKYNLNQPYLNGWSRGKCLDLAIRDSNSPCAEKWMAELGKPAIQKMIDGYGLQPASVETFTTDASAVAGLLARLQSQQDLSASSTKLFLASMLGQEYRDALPAGFAPWPVYDKVGFAGYVDYHDAAIVTLPDGSQIIVVMLTENAHSYRLADLASQIAQVLKADKY